MLCFVKEGKERGGENRLNLFTAFEFDKMELANLPVWNFC
jgi:hypothetical protein